MANGPDNSAASASTPTLKKITVLLVPKADRDLQRLMELTGLSITDIVNRAISLYEFVETQARNEKTLLVHDPETQETDRIEFI